jgi:ABC-type multidrug transport system ATPase subunit
MKQRLALAATLLGDPDVLVLDEPTNGVDAQGIAEIRGIIINVASQGRTVLLASHILDEVEKVCSYVAILKGGEVLNQGPISEVLRSHDIVEVAADNMAALGEALSAFAGTTSVKSLPHQYSVSLHPDVSTADLNRFLIEQGIVVSHLVRRQRSLESHFLSLLQRAE